MRKFFDYLLDLDESNLRWYHVVVIITLGIMIVAAGCAFFLLVTSIVGYPVIWYAVGFLFVMVLSKAIIMTWRDAHDD